MYSISQIWRGLKWSLESPNILIRELNRNYYRLMNGSEYNREGINVFDQDWDTLVILDACRFDMFENLNTLPGELECRISRGSHTSEFLRGNFNERSEMEVVYTTASPQLQRYKEEIDVQLHGVNNVWNTERWDTEEGTVLPEDMTQAAIEAHNKHPNKRHIVHYMQPHYPFIDSDIDDGVRGCNAKSSEGFDIWEQRVRGRLGFSPSEIWSPYVRNLKIALSSVKKLMNKITGRIVVTSDHGNMLGERSSPLPMKEWGHPSHLHTQELVRVPWLINEVGERRSIKSEPVSTDQGSIDESVVADRLEQLGYK